MAELARRGDGGFGLPVRAQQVLIVLSHGPGRQLQRPEDFDEHPLDARDPAADRSVMCLPAGAVGTGHAWVCVRLGGPLRQPQCRNSVALVSSSPHIRNN